MWIENGNIPPTRREANKLDRDAVWGKYVAFKSLDDLIPRPPVQPKEAGRWEAVDMALLVMSGAISAASVGAALIYLWSLFASVGAG